MDDERHHASRVSDSAAEARFRDGIAAFNDRDVERFLEFVDPEVVFETRSLPGVYVGPDGIRRYFEEWVIEPWEELHLELVRFEQLSDSCAIAELRIEGRSRETGLDVEMHYWDVLVARDDRLLRRTVHMAEEEARATAAEWVGAHL